MIPGPNRILRISPSGALVKIWTIISGNNFGARYWTDGKMEARMLPDEPLLRCHPTTKELFWTNECETVPKKKWWHHAPFARTPAINDYRRALASGLASSPEKERYIRMRYWWAANDPVRHGKNGASMPSDYHENLTKLRALLDESAPTDRLMAAEIARLLGDFDATTTLLQFPFPEGYAMAVLRIGQLNRDKDMAVRELTS